MKPYSINVRQMDWQWAMHERANKGYYGRLLTACLASGRTWQYPCINLCILPPPVQQPTTHCFVAATSDLVFRFCDSTLISLVTPASGRARPA